jgi:hypothetical protein
VLPRRRVLNVLLDGWVDIDGWVKITKDSRIKSSIYLCRNDTHNY